MTTTLSPPPLSSGQASPVYSDLSLRQTPMESSVSSIAPSADPSVIVGMACRVPGASNPSRLWDNIVSQKDLQRKMPADRFNVDAFYHPDGTNKGTTNAKYGYFLDEDIGLFDSGFFRISGKEAEAMDPQQRLLLEVVYEALEDAGISLSEIDGTQTAVFCGSFTNDYNAMTTKDLEYYPKYFVTGAGNAILSNRISYFYNLHGPSVTLDTACSSSLVCFHLGNKSLQTKESDIAIVVGSALHFDPNVFITMTDLGMLSVDGRCRAFDAGGSGYVRGEGICAVVLKRRREAERSGDPIRAVVRASGVNHDGVKQGITLPNTVAQENLIRSTYERAGLDPADTQYFEAHGTGTARGDPIETRAIGAVFGPSRQEPLYVGSVKSNIGHLEGASGLAGIIKTTLALEHAKIPPNMLFKVPNPEIQFDEWKIKVPVQLIDWPSTATGLRRASINSFGYGGTNAHIILDAYERSSDAPQAICPPELPSTWVAKTAERPFLIPLTAHSDKAGKLLEAKLVEYMQQYPDCAIGDLAYNMSSRRTMHPQRSFAIGRDHAEIIKALQEPSPAAAWTQEMKQRPRLGFVFTGQGAQWFAMGRQLIHQSPLFQQTLERCDAVLRALPDGPEWSVLEELLQTKETSRLTETRLSQPICTALQLALVDLLACWGVKPFAVVGHSSGEMAAAYAAGILSFENAIIAAYYRGLHMSNGAKGDTAVRGGMMAVGLTEAEAAAELKPYAGKICIAAVNSASTMTVSGDEDAIVKLKESLTERKIFARQLQVAQAFHSHHMVPLAPAYENALKNCPGFQTKAPRVRMFSSVTARLARSADMGPAYWAANMTGTVRFSDALTGILLDDEDEQNVDLLLEIGAHPALKGPSRQVMQALKLDLPYLASLTRNEDDYEGLLRVASQLFQHGYPVDLEAANSDHFLTTETGAPARVPRGQRLLNLPTYAWDHKRFWSETRLIREHRERKHRHSILGAPMPGSPEKYPCWRNYLRVKELPWLADHVVDGKVVFPAAGYFSIAIEAAVSMCADDAVIKEITLRDMIVKSALMLDDSDEGTEMLLNLRPSTTSAKSKSDAWYEFGIFSYGESKRCIEHCSGLVCVETGVLTLPMRADATRSPAVLRTMSHESIPSDNLYVHLASLGLEYGPNFQLLSGAVETGPGFALAPLTFQPTLYTAEPADVTIVHPTLLDASFHVIFPAIEAVLGRSLDEPMVPTFVRSFRVSGRLVELSTATETQHLEVCSFTRLPGPRVAISDLTVTHRGQYEPLLQFKGLEITSLGTNKDESAGNRSLFFRTRWQPAFSFLTADYPVVAEGQLAQLVDIFAHQYPNSKILHFSPTVDKTREVLQTLGGQAGERRRFKALSPSFPAGIAAQAVEALSKERPGLIDASEPQAGEYDLVIVNDATPTFVSQFLKEGGFLIADGVPVQPQEGLRELFRTGGLVAWEKVSPIVVEQLPVALIMPSLPSQRTLDIASQIEAQYRAGAVSRTSLSGLLTDPLLADNVVVLSSLDEAVLFDDEVADEKTYEAVKKLVTAVGKNIVWVLEGAAMDTPNPQNAMVIGLARVATSENDQLRLVTLDLPPASSCDAVTRWVLTTLNRAVLEDEISIREDRVFIPRVEADDQLNSKLRNGVNSQPRLERLGAGRPLALRIAKVGLLETLVFEDDEEILDEELADDEIELDVKASAINFRDIAASMGIIDDYKLGDECAGVVRRVGANVDPSAYKVGDRVAAWRPGQGAHRTIVRNPAVYCYKLTDTSFVEASAMLAILTTAQYSLVHIARLQPGECVLIHSAAGGVGQMAIQIAQLVGAQVLATVGSQAKRDLLKTRYGLKDDFIFNSRDDSFVQGVMTVTGGKGADVILNSLAGKLLHATWSCVAAFGRFIEIGKRDIHENSKIDMDPFRRNVAFASVDLITIFERNRPLGAQLLKECGALMDAGRITPPETVTELPYADAVKGFRLLQMGKHTGKVVLVPNPDDLVSVRPSTYRNRPLFHHDKAYLLVGGLGGLGRTLAEWMVKKNARRLVFLSRSGADRPEAQKTVAWLQERGITVTVHKGDVSDYRAVEACVKATENLAGIFQAAMVLQDAPLENMTHRQWRTCADPKVKGAYNLHRATADLAPLDFFICFSSASGSIGSKGQANYASANCYLDALMRHRREQGMAGATMNCGMIVGVGAVAENQALQKVMERAGYDGVNKEELLYQIEEAVLSNQHRAVTVSPRGIDLHQTITGINLSRDGFYWSVKPLFRNLYANFDFSGHVGQQEGTKSLSALIQAAADAGERTTILLAAFIEKVATVLSVAADTIQPSNPLSAYGLDSIIAVEFRKWFSRSVSVDIAVFDVLGAPSIMALVNKVSGLITLSSTVEEEQRDQANAADTKDGDDSAHVESQGGEFTQLIPTADMSAPIPMSTFQSRLWFIHNFAEDKAALNLPITAYVRGTPDREILEKSLNELISRNAILRTGYAEGEDFAEQVVHDNYSTTVDYVDLSAAQDPQVALNTLIQRLKSVELNIEDGQVVTGTLVRLGDDQHALVMICHHIAVDRGSAESSFRQWTGIYNAIRTSKDLGMVPQPAVSYMDFAVWHNKLLDSPSLAADLAFWKENLAGIPAACRLLPFAQSDRPLHDDSPRATVTATLRKELINRMKRICSQSGATPFHFLLTALRAFLFRYTEDDDLTILMVDGNRPHPDVEDVLGFFVNMIPIRCQDSGEGSFDQLLEVMKGRALQAMSHSKAPFDHIVDAMQIQKSTSHFPLAQVALNYQIHGTFPTYRTQDFSIYDVQSLDIPTACDMQLEALEHPERGLDLRLEYNAAMYAAADMDRFFDNFMTFLASSIQDHRQPLGEVNMCGPKEVTHLEQQYWNTGFTQNQWLDAPVCRRIIEQAEQQPNAVAVTASDGTSITYTHLVERAQRVAACLQASGLTQGQRVCLLITPGVNAITAMLAILLTRCCYVALDRDFAPDRLAFIMSDCGAKFVLFESALKAMAHDMVTKSTGDQKLVDISEAASFPEKAVVPIAATNDPFYMVYTSGSTGKPKGVVLSHGNTQQMLASLSEYFSFLSQDRFLQQSSLCFDLSVVQIFSALTAGAQVCVATADLRKDPIALADFMRQSAVTVTYFTPTHFALLCEHNADALRQCQAYRCALFAGERLPVRVAKAFYDLGTSATVYNTWSPSELVVQTTIHQVEYPEPGDVNIPIGAPLPNCRHYIVDAALNPLPAGFVGEICVGGAQVGLGYLNRPDATATSFVENPFCSGKDWARGWPTLFRTGDKGRFLPDGLLEFHGRIAGDKQIKLRGFRIDLGEVEQVLYQQSFTADGQGIVDVSVIARPVDGESGGSTASLTDDRQLIAFVVPKRPLPTPAAKVEYATLLLRGIQAHLNDYMLPNGYQFLHALPVTVGGKVDRQRLLRMELDMTHPSSSSSAASASVQTSGAMADAHAEILDGVVALMESVIRKGRKVAPTDNFFDLGGQSILLLRLQAKIKKHFGAALKLQDMIRSPTPLEITKMIRKSRQDDDAAPVATTPKSLTWADEVALPSNPKFADFHHLARLPRSEVENILLTGADTFIGIHLLAQILSAKPRAVVYLLGTHEKSQVADLIHELQKYQLLSGGLTEQDVLARTRPVAGYMSAPRFGLSDSAFKQLADSIHTIYNLAADVSLLKTYRDLKTINTNAIVTLIDLASSPSNNRVLEIHHLTTWSVPHLQNWQNAWRTRASISVLEEDPAHFSPPASDEYGYLKSRWAAEMILTEAATRGLPVSMYRASAVSGSLTSGIRAPSIDFISNMIIHMIRQRTIPEICSPNGPEFVINFIPVDALAAAIFHLAGEEAVFAPGMTVYHLGSSQPLPLRYLPALMSAIRQEPAQPQTESQVVPIHEWLNGVLDGASEQEQLHWIVIKEYFQQGHVMFGLDHIRTDAALKSVTDKVTFPAIDAEYLGRLWRQAGDEVARM